jgi:cytochrome c
MRHPEQWIGVGTLVGFAVMVCGLLASEMAVAGDVALGRYLSAECIACHPRDNRPKGIPAIIGWPQDQFVAVLQSYKAKERSNPVMQSVAASLTDEQIAALAAYFATLKPGG